MKDNNPRIFVLALYLTVAGSALAGSAWGQQPPSRRLPPQAEPRPFEERLPQPPPRQAPLEIPEPRLPETQMPAGAGEVHFQLQDLIVEGATAYTDTQLRSYFQDLLNREVSLAQVFDAAQQIENRYRSDGYLLSRTIVPPQEIRDGTVRIRVIEGYISEVVIEGELGDVKSRVQNYLNSLVGRHPVTIDDLERYLLLSNDLPGITARGLLRPATGEPGAAQLVVTTERDPFDGFAAIDNRGSRYTGEWSATGRVGANSFTSLGERVQVTGFSTFQWRERLFGEVALEAHPGSEGLTTRIYGSYSPSEPGFRLSDLDVKSKALRFGTAAEYPLIRMRRSSLWADAGFDYADVTTDALDQRLYEDNLRVLFLGIRGEYRDGFNGLSVGRLGLRQGLGILGASSEAGDHSRSGASGEFTKLTAEATRLQGLLPDLNLSLTIAGQYAFQKLLADEQFALGGISFGRGYDPSELTGDHALATSLELQYSPEINLPLVERLQFYGFYDFGMVWNRTTENSSARDSLASTGFGVRASPKDWLTVNLETAKPLTHAPAAHSDGSKPWRFLLTVLAEF